MHAHGHGCAFFKQRVIINTRFSEGQPFFTKKRSWKLHETFWRYSLRKLKRACAVIAIECNAFKFLWNHICTTSIHLKGVWNHKHPPAVWKSHLANNVAEFQTPNFTVLTFKNYWVWGNYSCYEESLFLLGHLASHELVLMRKKNLGHLGTNHLNAILTFLK